MAALATFLKKSLNCGVLRRHRWYVLEHGSVGGKLVHTCSNSPDSMVYRTAGTDYYCAYCLLCRQYCTLKSQRYAVGSLHWELLTMDVDERAWVEFRLHQLQALFKGIECQFSEYLNFWEVYSHWVRQGDFDMLSPLTAIRQGGYSHWVHQPDSRAAKLDDSVEALLSHFGCFVLREYRALLRNQTGAHC